MLRNLLANTNRLHRKAFTMIELVVVIVILGILAALAVPAFTNVITRSKDNVAEQEAKALIREAKATAAYDGGRITLVEADFDTDANTAGVQYVDGLSYSGGTWTYDNGKGAAVSFESDGILN